MKYYDISPLISSKLAVFPGDEPFKRVQTKQISTQPGQACGYELSSITTSVHIGAHADAPSHYQSGGISIDECSLDLYLGPCSVLLAPVKKEKPYRLLIDDIDWPESLSERVLFKTNSFLDVHHWQDDFTALSPELINYLADRGVCLVGVDTPSVDPATDTKLLSHQAIAKHGMAILEGLVLSEVPPGEYSLVALPLKIKDADASPVRAILIQGG